MSLRVELYSTTACGLCADARRMLMDLKERIPFELNEVELTPEDPLYSRYRDSVPVVVVNGQRELGSPIQQDQVARALQEVRQDSPGGAGEILKWIGLSIALAGLLLRFIGRPESGYAVFGTAIIVFSIGWVLVRLRRRSSRDAVPHTRPETRER